MRSPRAQLPGRHLPDIAEAQLFLRLGDLQPGVVGLRASLSQRQLDPGVVDQCLGGALSQVGRTGSVMTISERPGSDSVGTVRPRRPSRTA